MHESVVGPSKHCPLTDYSIIQLIANSIKRLIPHFLCYGYVLPIKRSRFLCWINRVCYADAYTKLKTDLVCKYSSVLCRSVLRSIFSAILFSQFSEYHTSLM